jgi:hypothetical protein
VDRGPGPDGQHLDAWPTRAAWARCTTSGSATPAAGFVNVGTDQATYTLGDADVGGTIRVIVSYTDGQGVFESETSGATAAVANVNDAADRAA